MWLPHFTSTWTRTAYLDLISDIQVPVGFSLRVSFNCLPCKASLKGEKGGEERKKKGKGEGKEGRMEEREGRSSFLVKIIELSTSGERGDHVTGS